MEDGLILQDTSEKDGSGALRKPGITYVAMLYSVVVVLFLSLGSKAQRREFYSGILITEFVLILVPVLVLLFVFRYDVKKVLRLNRLSVLSAFLIAGIMLFALPVVGVVNLANLWLVDFLFGRTMVVQPPVAGDMAGLLLSVFVIGLTPAICEETMFRGVIQRGFERFGTVKSILMASFLFGLIHVDFQKLFGTFLLGALIGFIVYRTDSLYGGMVAHFTNNTIATLAAFGSSRMMEMLKSSGVSGADGQVDTTDVFSAFANMPVEQLIMVAVVWGVIIAFCTAVLIGLIIALVKTTDLKPRVSTAEARIPGRPGLLWLIPGLSAIGFVYFAQGLKLMEINNAFMEKILRMIM